MKHIFLNLKRFDIPKEYGGVNSIAPVADWGAYIVENTQEALKKYAGDDVEFAMYFPEAHVLGAAGALCADSPVQVGCQSVYRDDTAVGGNFGAFTANRTANPPPSSVTARNAGTRPECWRKPGLRTPPRSTGC